MNREEEINSPKPMPKYSAIPYNIAKPNKHFYGPSFYNAIEYLLPEIGIDKNIYLINERP